MLIFPGVCRQGVRQLDRARQVEAKVVISNTDPFRLRELTGAERFGPDLNRRLDAMRRDGTTLKAPSQPCRLLSLCL